MSKPSTENHVRVRHFFDKNKHLVATIATADLNDSEVAVAVARCNPEDTPRRKLGRQIAEGRLKRYMSYKKNPHKSSEEQGAHIEEMIERNFVFTMPRDQLINDVIKAKENPFTQSNCKYGRAVEEENAVLR